MIASSARSARNQPCRLSADCHQYAQSLMHQQLYVLGRDIAANRGNQLIQYGCEKVTSDIPAIPSIYIHRPRLGIELGFRGFGVFVGAEEIGGAFIRRFEFKPRWMPSYRMPRNAWLVNDLPAGKAPRSMGDQAKMGQLLVILCDWFIDYETTIKQRFGHRYRLGQLLHFRRLNTSLVHPDLAKGWQAVRQWFESK